MLQVIEKNKQYISESGYRFQVLHLAKHGQDCSYPMVVYTNLEATADRPAFEIWTISESIFLKRFSEYVPESYRFIGCFNETSALPTDVTDNDIALVGHADIYVYRDQVWTLTLGDFVDKLTYQLHPDSDYYWSRGDWLNVNDTLFVLVDGGYFARLSMGVSQADRTVRNARHLTPGWRDA